MILTLPDDPALAAVSAEEMRLDLACGLYATGRISRGVGARIAGVDRRDFDEALFVRRISPWNEETLAQDLRAIAEL